MEQHFLSYRNSRVHYLKFGRGTRFLFCFHGYGEDAYSFLFLEKVLGADFILIALDLPYHGRTEWNEGFEFRPLDLRNIMHSIVPLDLQAVSLTGYSMGGRIALAMVQEMPSHIDRAVLVAPDGLHQNFWYWFSTQTLIGNRLFRHTMKKPAWFFGGMRLMRGLNLLNKSIFKFAHAYLDDENERAVLYSRWTTMRKFLPRTGLLSAALKRHAVQVRMLFGSYDRIILSKRSGTLDKENNSVKAKTIRAGHQLLKEKYAKDIATLFYE
ncbi:MAG: alpha/beta hydrolase fold protein [Chitinophagaceae bacterium]|jgi:pimeloyl-ACP methyl ester carboxylesterase|nr:alpha/beta hydrolase fold protein [Chitinophagaceae bacterium]